VLTSDPPPLTTLNQRPSWVNRAGRVDRSACTEIRASELWPKCTNMKPAPRTTDGPLAVGTVTIHTRWLARLHGNRHPFALQGDYRTAKSNAMKDPTAHAMRKPDASDGSQSWPFNPNRSAARTKMLGLWVGGEPGFDEAGPGTQTIRIERWQRTRKNSRKKDIGRKQTSRLPNPTPPTYQHFIICPRCEEKFSKLFMVLCSKQEVFDAELAEGWIARTEAMYHDARAALPAEFYQHRAKLIDRYGLLFRGRRLACRTCLGIRYGQVREPARRVDTYVRDKAHRDMARGYEMNRPQ